MAYLTEQELLERYEFYTLQVEQQLRRGEDFRSLCEAMPFAAHLNDPTNLELISVNRAHSEQTGHEMEEILEMGLHFHRKVVHPKSLALYPLLLRLSKEDATKVFCFVHYILERNAKLGHRPVITFTKPVGPPINGLLCLSPEPSNFGSNVNKMNQLVEIDEFKLKNFKRFEQLTQREVQVLGLLSNGYNNCHIGERLNISRHTVETHRKKLKAKLELKSFRDIMKFALAFDLLEL